MNRENFLVKTAAGISGLLFLPGFVKSQDLQTQIKKQTNDPDPLKPEIVKEFVIAGHGGKNGDLDKVKSMLNDYPNIIYGTIDWGSGDFESAIDGAGHMGNKELANYLIESGSRVTLFVLTMLGKTELVKPVLEAYPKLLNAIGPHGFTMLHHAKAGGKDSEDLFQYLQEKGVTKPWVKIK